MPTLAIHVVWTTYGTWLPGNVRGHWSPLYDIYGNIRESGGKLNVPDQITRRRAAELMKESPLVLGQEEISIVADELGRHFVTDVAAIAPGKPGAICYAAGIEPKHAHLLLGPIEEDISKCVGRLKGTSSSAVLKCSAYQDRQRVWTQGYWKVFLFDKLAVASVKKYIDAHNLRRGLKAEPYSWISPCPYFI